MGCFGSCGAAQIVGGTISDAKEIQDRLFSGDKVDAVISCIASRSGTPGDSWAVDCDGNVNLLDASLAASDSPAHFVMLSAFCVRQPELVVRTRPCCSLLTHVPHDIATASVRLRGHPSVAVNSSTRLRHHGRPGLLPSSLPSALSGLML